MPKRAPIEEVDRVLSRGIDRAEGDHPTTVAQIAEFNRQWRAFQEIKDQAPAAVTPVKASVYSTS